MLEKWIQKEAPNYGFVVKEVKSTRQGFILFYEDKIQNFCEIDIYFLPQITGDDIYLVRQSTSSRIEEMAEKQFDKLGEAFRKELVRNQTLRGVLRKPFRVVKTLEEI